MLSMRQKRIRVIVYGTLGASCLVALIVALAVPDEFDVGESQIAAVYLTLLIGSNKAFNAKPLCRHQGLGAIAVFIGAGLVPAAIVHVALAQLEPGQNAHSGTLLGYGIVTGFTTLLVAPWSFLVADRWQAYEAKYDNTEAQTGPV